MGGQEAPRPGVTKQNSTTRVNMNTTSDVKPTFLTDEAFDAATGNLGRYEDALVDYDNMIGDWNAVPFTGDELQAFEMAKAAAGAGGPMQSSIDQMRDVVEGKYLFGGEGFNAAVDAAYRAGMPGVLSAFGGGGRSDGGLAKVALARAFSDPFAMQYGQERERQDRAAAALPSLSMMPSSVWESIGGKARELAQYGINTPFDLMKNYLSLIPGLNTAIQPFMGQFTKGTQQGTTRTKGTITETPSYFEGYQGAGILGGALSGAGMGAQLGSVIPGIGTGIGAGVGALAGGLGGLF